MGILEEYAARSEAQPGATPRQPIVRVWKRDKIVADGFAGGGGATEGIRRALGRGADIAINHDEAAIAMHRQNHPDCTHYREDVWKVDPLRATGGHPVGLLWLSPDCKHFSKARGAKPVDKKIRGLAWVAIRWAKSCRPDVIILENVVEFQQWGPTIPYVKKGVAQLDKQGRELRIPDPKRKGQTFRQWRRKLEGLGYRIEWRELAACDYGAPTTRKRLFLIARCDEEDIVWPEPTHGEGLEAYRSAGSVIDFTLPTRSIFGRKKDLADQTLARIAHGIPRHLKNGPFLVRHGHAATRDKKTGKPFTDVRVGKDGLTFRGQADLRQPMGVVCATNDKGLVVPMLRPVGSRGKSSAEPLVAAWIQKNNGGARGGAIGSSLHGPLHTITGTCQQSLVVAFLDKYNGNGSTQSIDEPMHTVTGTARFGLVTMEIDGETYEITDIHYRMLQPKELYAAQGFGADYIFEFEHEGKPLTQAEQIRKAGNSVCPDVAKALVGANAPEGV